jgi:hypothetical protein
MPRLATETIGAGDMSWLGSPHGIWDCRTVAPDSALFSAAAYPDGVPSGTPIGIVTATGLAGPYTGDSTDEVQTLTEGGSGLTSWTATFAGQTTASLDDDATIAQVQAALEALSTIGEGNVIVTGTTAPIAMTVTFTGDLANANQPAITTTPTGGTGTVVVATTTAGGADAGSDGREVLAGFLFTDQKAPADGGWPLLDHGKVKVGRLPIPFAATGHNTSGLFVFIPGEG